MTSGQRDKIDRRLLPDRAVSALSLPRIAAHTAYSSLRDYKRSPRGPSVPGPIFVVGSPRSGTTMFGTLLSRLPGISYHFEPVAVKAAVPYVYLGLWSDRSAERWFRGTYGMLQALHGAWGRTLVDKTPRNVFVVSDLARWFPKSKFIFVLRDGRDAAVSWAEKPWMQQASPKRYEPGGYRYGPGPHFWVESDRVDEFIGTSTLHRCAWGWRRHVEHWLNVRDTIPTERRIEVRYETVVGADDDEVARISRFLGFGAEASNLLAAGMSRLSSEPVGRWRSSDIGRDDNAMEEMRSILDRVGYPTL